MSGPLPFFPAEPAVAVELLGMVVSFGGLLWWQARRRKRLEHELKQHDQRLQILEQSLLCAPDGWYGWQHVVPAASDEDGEDESLFAGGQCSRRLAVLLGLYGGRAAPFSEVLAAFSAQSSERLIGVVERLRSQGEGFEVTLERATEEPATSAAPSVTPRHIRVWGIRAVADDGTPLADLVWMRDVTAEDAAYALLSERTTALEIERRRLFDALDVLPTPIWVRNDSLQITFANKAFLSAVEAKDVSEVQAEDRELALGTAGRELRALASAARASNEARQTALHVVLGGRRRLLEISETPLLDRGLIGGERVTVGLAHDMTRLETLRATLEQEATSHAMVLHRLGTAIAIFGGDGQLHFHNTAYAKLWLLEEQWLSSSPTYGEILEAQRSRRLLPEVADYPAFKEAELGRFKSLLEPVEDLLHLPDGKTLRRVLTPHPLGGLLATYEDVTDRLALEASRNELIAVQRETIDHLHEAVAVFGADGRLQLCNPAFSRLWGVAEDVAAAHPTLAQLETQATAPLHASPVWQEIRTQLAAPPRAYLAPCAP